MNTLPEFSCSEIIQRLQQSGVLPYYNVSNNIIWINTFLWWSFGKLMVDYYRDQRQTLWSETDTLSVQFRPFPQTSLHSLRCVELPWRPCDHVVRCALHFLWPQISFLQALKWRFLLIIWSGVKTLFFGENLFCNLPLYRHLSKFYLWLLFLLMHHCLWCFLRWASKRKFSRRSRSLSPARPKSWWLQVPFSRPLLRTNLAWVTFSI